MRDTRYAQALDPGTLARRRRRDLARGTSDVIAANRELVAAVRMGEGARLAEGRVALISRVTSGSSDIVHDRMCIRESASASRADRMGRPLLAHSGSGRPVRVRPRGATTRGLRGSASSPDGRQMSRFC